MPKFIYCVNATIANETSSANVVFFNEAMTAILNIDCREMVVKHGYTDPKVLPNPILLIRGIPKLLHMNSKKDGSIAVNKVFEVNDPPTTTSKPKKIAIEP